MSNDLRMAEKLLSAMPPADKAQILAWLRSDPATGGALPGIEQAPEVCGGDPCIAGTRIPIWLLEQYRRLGASESELLQNYPVLTAQDLVNVWNYARTHGEEIDGQIRENEADDEALALEASLTGKLIQVNRPSF